MGKKSIKGQARNTKGTAISALLFLSSFVYCYLAYIGYKDQHIDLSECSKVTSVIIDKGLEHRRETKGPSLCFYLSLEGSSKKLGEYRWWKNYDDLDDKFHAGDTVTAYFLDNHNAGESINIDLVQVEKNGQVRLGKQEYAHKQRTLVWIGALGGLAMLGVSWSYYRKKVLMNKARR